MRLPGLGDILLDKYRVDEALGEGGFGAVFLATTVKSGRRVAVKILKPGPSGYQLGQVARFTREMRAIANLSDPHTLTLYDFGRLDSGLLAMVTEYVEGRDLLELLAQGPVGEGEVVHVLLQVLYSLREAHAAGLLHRDIKPGNIRLFEHQGDPLRVKVLDFGLALTPDGPEARLTATGRVIGTPRYMSPEHRTGQPLTPATDVYSVGVVALEMLVGRERLIDMDVASGPAGRRVPADLEISPRLRSIVDRMLALEVRDRYASAAEVIKELRPLRQVVAVQKRAEQAPTRIDDEPPPMSTIVAPAEVPQAEPAGVDPKAILRAAVVTVALSLVAIAALMPEPPPHTPPVVSRAATGLVRTMPEPEREPQPEPEVPGLTTACERGDLPFRGFGELRGASVTATRHLAYVPTSAVESRKMPLLFFALSQDRRDWEEKRGKYGFPLIRALAERLQAVAMFPVVDSRPSVNVENALQMLNTAAESVCIDESRVIWVAPNQQARMVHEVACSFRGVVASVGGPVEPSPCNNPHVHVFQDGDRAWPPGGWPSCDFTPKSKTYGCLDDRGKRRRKVPRDAARAHEVGCLRSSTSVPSHETLMAPVWTFYGCDSEPEEHGPDGRCEFARCAAGTLGFCTSEGGRPWTPLQLPHVETPEQQHSWRCAGQPNPRAGIDKMIAGFARYHWDNLPTQGAP